MSTVPAIHSKTRRSSRLNQAIALTVQGADASHTPFLERVSTLTVSCHGCRYRSKNKVLLGDVLQLAVEGSDRRGAGPSRARVKQVLQLAANENPFEIVLELESPGNIWAIPTPPEDWFPVRDGAAGEASASGLRVLPRNETQVAQTTTNSAPAVAERAATAASPNQFLAQFMTGLNEQIRVIAADAATAAIAKERSRILEEFRGQLREEAKKTLEQAIVVARDGAGSKVLHELNVAHESAARTTYERWTKKLEQDFAETAQRSVSLGSKVNERVEKAAAITAERVQQNLDASRREAVDQFRARLRTEVAPLVEETQAVVQKLAAFQDEVKVRSLEICGQFSDFLKQEAERSSAEIQQKVSECDQQIANAAKGLVSQASEELERKSAEVAGASTENLRKASQEYEQAAQERLNALTQSSDGIAANLQKMSEGHERAAQERLKALTETGDGMAANLQKMSEECQQAAQERLKALAESNVDLAANLVREKIAELSGQFSSEMENYRNYLQLISASIGEIAKRPVVPAQE